MQNYLLLLKAAKRIPLKVIASNFPYRFCELLLLYWINLQRWKIVPGCSKFLLHYLCADPTCHLEMKASFYSCCYLIPCLTRSQYIYDNAYSPRYYHGARMKWSEMEAIKVCSSLSFFLDIHFQLIKKVVKNGWLPKFRIF